MLSAPCPLPGPDPFPRVGTRRDPDLASELPAVVELCDLVGLSLLQWQSNDLDVALEVRPDGSWRWSEVGLIASRQNGKTTVAEARILAGLYLFGDRILHTAQNLALPTQTFRTLAELVESTPWLDQVSKIRRVNAAESIEVRYLRADGSWYSAAYYVVAPSARRARGHRGISLVVVDELREQTDRELVDAGLRPTTVAVPNSQIWYLSNAGGDESVVLNDLRDRGRAAVADPVSSRLCWLEHSADPALAADDPAAWAQGNPSLDVRLPDGTQLITWESLRAEYEGKPVDTFRVEHLCQWLDGISVAAVDPERWARCGERPPPPIPSDLPVAVGVELDPDRRGAAVAVAADTSGIVAADVIWSASEGVRPADVAAAVASLAAARRVAAVYVDPGTSAEVVALFDPSVPVVEVAGRQWLEASRRFVDLVETGGLAHSADPAVAAEIAVAGRRPVADGSWSITRRDSLRPIPSVLALIRAVYGSGRPNVRPFVY